MKFTKWQGCGNDFVLLDCMKSEPADYVDLARRMCDRHFGIGADGIIAYLPSTVADIRMRIFNTDGSEAEMCGNGIRCFAIQVYSEGLVDQVPFTVETGAGVLVIYLKFAADGRTPEGVRVDMGEPQLVQAKVPAVGLAEDDEQRVINAPLTVGGREFRATAVSMGNPHCVVFVDDAENFPIYEFGPQFESDAHFPRHTNTEFVEVKDRNHVRMRVWERGAAVTLACGTGACATAVAGVLNGKTDRQVEIQLDGGKLSIEWDEKTNHVFMTGPAQLVYRGEWAD